MRRRRWLLVVGAAMALTATLGEPAAGDAEAAAALDAALAASLDEHGVRGASLAVVQDWELVHVTAVGEAEPGRQVEPDTLFQAASLSKPVSASVAAAAAQRGLVDLDVDVTTMLTRWRLPPHDEGGDVTCRLLFAQRGGVNVGGFPGYRLDEPLARFPRLLDGVVGKNEPIRVTDEPGDYRYSGGGYLIAQLAIEDTTGARWATLATELVFQQLGMEESTFVVLGAHHRSDVAVGHRSDGAEVAGGGWHRYPEIAPASLWTTAEEYARFTLDTMRSYQLDDGVVLGRDAARSMLDPERAMGFSVIDHRDRVEWRHLGANEGYRSGVVAHPHRGDAIVLLSNGDDGLDVFADVEDTAIEVLGWPEPPSGGGSMPWPTVVLAVGSIAVTCAAVLRRRRRAASRRRGLTTGPPG
ncbi:MAG: serine hydrolase domain-containing protein [Actinomycetota bacterium]